MEVAPMKTLGVWLVILAVASFLLQRVGIYLLVLYWIYNWGPNVAAAIQIGMLLLGLALIAAGVLRARARPKPIP